MEICGCHVGICSNMHRPHAERKHRVTTTTPCQGHPLRLICRNRMHRATTPRPLFSLDDGAVDFGEDYVEASGHAQPLNNADASITQLGYPFASAGETNDVLMRGPHLRRVRRGRDLLRDAQMWCTASSVLEATMLTGTNAGFDDDARAATRGVQGGGDGECEDTVRTPASPLSLGEFSATHGDALGAAVVDDLAVSQSNSALTVAGVAHAMNAADDVRDMVDLVMDTRSTLASHTCSSQNAVPVYTST